MIRYLQRVTQALAAVRTHEAVFAIVLQDALDALGGIVEPSFWSRMEACRSSLRGQDDHSVWQDGDLRGHPPSPDALRSNTPLFFSHHGDLTAAYQSWKPIRRRRSVATRSCRWWKRDARWVPSC